MEDFEEQRLSSLYGDQKVQEMVMIKYKKLRADGFVESLEDIYTKQPMARIHKDNYSFTFDLLKNSIEDKMTTQSKILRILEKETKHISSIQLKNFKETTFDNEADLYTERLQSGLPIFKSIIYMRYQSNDKWEELMGEDHAFFPDQHQINVEELKSNIPKIKLFLEDQKRMNKVQFQFTSNNQLTIKEQRYPCLQEIQKRADVLAKLLLLSIYTEEHRKLKQLWKNDENYQEMIKNQKKIKSEVEPEKLKEGEQENLDESIRYQVIRILDNMEEKANIIAHDHFKQHNGQKAVKTKKSLEKLIANVKAEPNPRLQLRMLVAYKQKKSW